MEVCCNYISYTTVLHLLKQLCLKWWYLGFSLFDDLSYMCFFLNRYLADYLNGFHLFLKHKQCETQKLWKCPIKDFLLYADKTNNAMLIFFLSDIWLPIDKHITSRLFPWNQIWPATYGLRRHFGTRRMSYCY